MAVILSQNIQSKRGELAVKVGLPPVLLSICLHYFLVGLANLLPISNSMTFVSVLHSRLDKLLQWDAVWYSSIGRFGYRIPTLDQRIYFSQNNSVPFSDPLQAAAYFPGLPAVVHVVGITGALVLGNLVFIASILLLYHVVQLSLGHSLASFAAMFYAVNPASIYETALYPEVYLVFLSLTVVYAIRQQRLRWNITALAAVVVLGTFHQLGCLAIVFALRYIRNKRYLWAAAFALSSCLGWAIDLAYFSYRFHQPFATFIAEHQWNRQWRFPGTGVLMGLIHGHLFEAAIVIVMVAFIIRAVVFSIRSDAHWSPAGPMSLGSAEVGIWVIMYCFLDLSTYIPDGPVISVIRFLSVLWPIYSTPWFRARKLGQSLWPTIVLIVSGSVSLFGDILFTHGFFYQ